MRVTWDFKGQVNDAHRSTPIPETVSQHLPVPPPLSASPRQVTNRPMSRNNWRPEEHSGVGLRFFRLAIYNGCRWQYAPVSVTRLEEEEEDLRLAEYLFLPSFLPSFLRKAGKLRYGCLRPDVEQSGTLQEQLRAEAAIVVIVASSSFYWRITSFCNPNVT